MLNAFAYAIILSLTLADVRIQYVQGIQADYTYPLGSADNKRLPPIVGSTRLPAVGDSTQFPPIVVKNTHCPLEYC